MRAFNFLIAYLLLFHVAHAQEDTVRILKGVTVTGLRETEIRQNTLNIEPIKSIVMEQKGSLNLSDALAKTPGISQMTTGFAISKPVIRGLYGNRILTLVSGLRFDNQQWQDEHGMGLSIIGVQRTEIIKGPASILYGTDALGGIINIIEEQVHSTDKKMWDVNTRLYSNTLGTVTDVGYRNYADNKWFRIRAGLESHTDYSDGNGDRVLNSRANGYYLKTGWGSQRHKWTHENTYNASYNNYGFIVEDLNDVFTEDARRSRKMIGPHHTVVLNIFNSKHTRTQENSSLQVNGGLQSNLRLENEGGGQVSLNIHLFSALANVRWEKQIRPTTSFIANGQFTYENSTNFGARILIPDANMVEVNGSAFLRHSSKFWILESGLGIGDKALRTYETDQLNSPDKEIQPFSINKPSINGILGAAFLPNDKLTIKTNIASGYRVPNLSELSSNGLHEGTIRYEIGNPDLKTENNINGDVTVQVADKLFDFYVSGFFNQINNYIYLSPTTEEFFGYPIYRYQQQDSHLYGGEAMLNIHPVMLQGIQFKNSYMLTKGILDSSGYLPFIPAQKLTSSVRYERTISGRIPSFYFELEYVYVFSQKDAANFETPTAAYELVNLYTGVTIPRGNSEIDIFLSGQNFLNEVYADHLSRLKYYGLFNPGRNIMLTVHFPIH